MSKLREREDQVLFSKDQLDISDDQLLVHFRQKAGLRICGEITLGLDRKAQLGWREIASWPSEIFFSS